MKTDEVKDICQIIARLVDAVEAIARRADAEGHELDRLHNIRHDSLILLNRVR